MKKIWIKVIHPAPYTYVWKQSTLEYFDIDFYYDFDESMGKVWKDYDKEKINKSNYSLSLIKKIRKALTSDMTILSGWNRKDNLIIALFVSFFSKKKVYFFADFPLKENNKFFDFFKYLLIKFLSNGLLSATQSGVAYFSSKPFMDKKNIYYLPYGVSVQSCYDDNVITKIENRKKLKKIFIASNMIPRKGHLFFVDAISQLSEKMLSDFEIHFAGHGENAKMIEDKMKDIKVKSIFHGWLSLKEYEQLLSEIDILVHPSFEEPFGIPPIEAMFFGKIVVVSSGVHSLDGLIKNGSNGFVYNKDDLEDFKEIFLAAISIDNKSISTNAKITAENNFGQMQFIHSFKNVSIDK